MKDLIIIGVGGVGRETALIVEQLNLVSKEWNLLGFVDDNKEVQGKTINGYKVLGGIDYITGYNDEIHVVCCISNYKIKKAIIESIKSTNSKVKFPSIIHPSIRLNKTIEIGEGCIIYENAVITANIKIGNYVIISPKCGIGHDSIINDYVTLLWNVNVSGNVVLEEGVTMGSGSTTIQGIKIGRQSFIGAGAVVIRDKKPYKKAAGVPALYIGDVDGYEENTVYNNG